MWSNFSKASAHCPALLGIIICWYENFPCFCTKIFPLLGFNFPPIFCPPNWVVSVSKRANPTLLFETPFRIHLLPLFFIHFLPRFSYHSFPLYSIPFLTPFSIHFLPPFHTIPTPVFHTLPTPIFHTLPTPVFHTLPTPIFIPFHPLFFILFLPLFQFQPKFPADKRAISTPAPVPASHVQRSTDPVPNIRIRVLAPFQT